MHEHMRFTPGGSLHHLFKGSNETELARSTSSLESPYTRQKSKFGINQHSILLSSENSEFSIDDKDKGHSMLDTKKVSKRKDTNSFNDDL